MNVKYKNCDDNLYIFLYGELDEYSAPDVKRQLEKITFLHSLPKSVVFDLSGVSFMDSTGIGMFLGRYKTFQKQKIPVYLTGANANVEKVFEISGIYRLMPKV